MKKLDHQILHPTATSPHQELQGGLDRWVGGLRVVAEDPEDLSIPGDPEELASLKKEFTDQGVHQTEEKFRALIELSTDGILMCSPDGTVIYASPSIGRLFEHETGQLVGAKGLEFVHPDEQESTRLLWADLLKTPGNTVRVEVRYRHKDGTWHWMEAVGTNLLREPGVEAVVVNFRDINERKALDLQMSYFHQLFENSPAGIALLDDQDIILNANKAFEKMFQYPVKETRMHNIRDLIVSQPYREEAEWISAAVRDRKVVQKESVRTRRDGTSVAVNIMGYPIIMDNKLVGVFAVYSDVTEAKRVEEHLRETQKMESIGTLAGGIAHDFNNILLVIIAQISTLARFRAQPKKFARSLEILNKMTLRARALVKQLLTFARKSKLTLESVRVNELMIDLMKLMGETFPKTMMVTSRLEKQLPTIRGDANQLHQVLLNLCVNARDAMPTGGTIHLETGTVPGKPLRMSHPNATAKEYVRLRISDTGIGMDPATRARIFEPFFTTKQSDKGTGLGLSVVYGIVEHHNGFIDVESDLGRGTTIDVYFPAEERKFPSVKQMERAQQKVAGGTETILVIEDEEDVRDWVTTTLVEKGYEVLAAADGLEAIKLFNGHRSEIALVVLDAGLPALGGGEVFLRLKEIEPELKVIVASGYLEPEVKSRLLEAGAMAFMEKPYTTYDLLKRIREVIDATPVPHEISKGRR